MIIPYVMKYNQTNGVVFFFFFFFFKMGQTNSFYFRTMSLREKINNNVHFFIIGVLV